MKKIVVLGAGVYQVPLIQAAKDLGIYVIVVSIAGNYPGFALADKTYEINTTDKEAILAMAKKEQISAIVTTGTDVAVSTLGYVCDALGLPGLSCEAARLVTDKALMKEAFLRGGVTTAEFRVVHSCEEAKTAFCEIGAPAILKIVDKSGSRGITKVETLAQLKQAYEYAARETGADHMVLERYIDGKEIGVDAFVQNGEIKLIVPHDKLVFQSGRTGIPLGHICPMPICSETLGKKIEEETQKVIRAIGLDHCAVNMDVFITPNEEVYVIEAAGRCGATGIPEVLSRYLGVDYYQLILKNALGEQINKISVQGRPTASVLLHSEMDGYLDSIEYDFDGVHYCNEDSVVSSAGYVQLDNQPGDVVHFFENGTHRMGQAIIEADTLQEVLDQINAFQQSIVIRLH